MFVLLSNELKTTTVGNWTTTLSSVVFVTKDVKSFNSNRFNVLANVKDIYSKFDDKMVDYYEQSC